MVGWNVLCNGMCNAAPVVPRPPENPGTFRHIRLFGILAEPEPTMSQVSATLLRNKDQQEHLQAPNA